MTEYCIGVTGTGTKTGTRYHFGKTGFGKIDLVRLNL